MATLQKIRNRAGLLVGVLGFALLAFILGELLNSGTSIFNRYKDKAFTVNGDVVSTKKYQDRVTQMEEFQKALSQNNSLTEEESARIKDEVYQQMVKEMILDDQAGELGLTVTKEEMNDLVFGQNLSPVLTQMFGNPQTGQVNREAISQFLKAVTTDVSSAKTNEEKAQLLNVQAQWAIIENMIKYQRLEEKYTSLFAGALLVNNIEAKASFESTKKSADIAYVVQRYSAVPDSTITVTDAEIKKLYEERKNNFKSQTDLRKISYFVKDVIPSADDYAAVEKQINAVHDQLQKTDKPELIVADYSEKPYEDIYVSETKLPADVKTFVETAAPGAVLGPIKGDEEFSVYRLVDKTVRPDTVSFRMISIPEGANKNISTNFADSVLNVVKGGKDFATVANELQPNSNGGLVEKVTEEALAYNKLDKDFINTSFNTPIGEIVKITSRGAIHILKIEYRSAAVSKVKLATVYMTVPVSDRTINGIDSELNKFVSANGNKDSFVKVANEKGYNISADVLVNPAAPSLNGINGSRSVIHWAYNEKVGSIKKFDTETARIVALITEDIKEGYLPYTMTEINSRLKAEIIKNKKAEKFIAAFKAKPATNLDAYAQNFATKVDTCKFVSFGTPNIQGLGREYVMNVYAELGKVNAVTGPVKGENGVYVLSVLNSEEQPATYQPEAVKLQLQRRYNNILGYTLASMNEAMKVKDNRAKFY
ncbi:MAG: peptidylprolyl isomerase [Dysgonomonas sp.]